MAQSKFSQLDGIKFDPENHAGVEIYINTLNGTLMFKDQEVTEVPLSKLVGFENIDSVFLVGKSGNGARYKNIQDAINDVPVTSTSLTPTVIFVTAGVYNESLLIQKDGLHIIGLGRVVIKGVDGSPSVLINDIGGIVPQLIQLENLIIEKEQDGQSCIEITGSLDSTLLQKSLTIKDCYLSAIGIGSYPVKADTVNSIKILGGTWEGSRSDSICSISQVASFECVGLHSGTDFQLSYDSASDTPLTKTSEYTVRSMLKGGDFLVSLLGTGSLTIDRSTTGDLSITGDRTLSLSDSQTNNLTVQGTTACSVQTARYGTISGDATVSLSLNELRGSVDFVATDSVSVSLPLPYPNSLYMVLIDGYDGVTPFVSNKTASSFDISYPDGVAHTTTVYYQVII